MIFTDPGFLRTGLVDAPARDLEKHGMAGWLYSDENPMSDMLARQALKLLSNNLITACENGSNLKARQAMLLGAFFAGQAFSN